VIGLSEGPGRFAALCEAVVWAIGDRVTRRLEALDTRATVVSIGAIAVTFALIAIE
jgi:hypothetical protein